MSEAVAGTPSRLVEVDEKELARLRSVAEHHERIMEKQKEVAKLRDKYLAKKDESLAAKKTMDQSINELSDMIQEGPDKQLRLFDTQSESQEEENWADMPIDRLDITPAIKKKLIDANTLKLGDLVLLYAGKNAEFPNGFKDIKGLGPGKIETLKEAMRKIVPDRELDGPKLHEPSDDEVDGGTEEEPIETAVDLVESEVQEVTEEQAEPASPVDDAVEETESEPFAEDSSPVKKPEVKRIRLTKDVYADAGLVQGSEHDATFGGSNTAEIEYEEGAEPFLLIEGEYELV